MASGDCKVGSDRLKVMCSDWLTLQWVSAVVAQTEERSDRSLVVQTGGQREERGREEKDGERGRQSEVSSDWLTILYSDWSIVVWSLA